MKKFFSKKSSLSLVSIPVREKRVFKKRKHALRGIGGGWLLEAMQQQGHKAHLPTYFGIERLTSYFWLSFLLQ